MSRLCVLSLVCLLAPAVFAQVAPVDKGSADDMRGAKSVFVDTGARTDLHDAIVANLHKELPEITVVETVEEAALVVRFQTTVAPKGSALEQADADRRATLAQRSSTQRPVPAPAPANPGDRTSGLGRTDRSNPGPNTVPPPDSGRNRSEAFDVLLPDPDDTPREYRYAIGTVLKPSGTNRYTEALSYVRKIEGETIQSIRDFVKKFAKAHRKANPKSS